MNSTFTITKKNGRYRAEVDNGEKRMISEFDNVLSAAQWAEDLSNEQADAEAEEAAKA